MVGRFWMQKKMQFSNQINTKENEKKLCIPMIKSRDGCLQASLFRMPTKYQLNHPILFQLAKYK